MARLISIVYDRIRWDEKALIEEMKSRDIEANLIDAKLLVLNTPQHGKTVVDEFGDIVLQRCISHFRGLYITAMLENFGVKVVNSFDVSEKCGNKLLTTLCLAKAGVPIPKTKVAFSPDGAFKAIEAMGYPAVLKPIIGSWGRLVAAIRSKEMAQTILEMRSYMNGPMNQIFYVQEMVKRPPRDIRCIVAGEEIIAAVYRYAPPNEWRTNVALGGKTVACPITPELREIVLKATKAVGGGVLGVDLMEAPEGLVVNELNPTVEFKGAAAATDANIPKAIIDYVLSLIKR
ncbi:MAG: lysine biosynthesis protein LysX [Nitrososphaerota archaeon]